MWEYFLRADFNPENMPSLPQRNAIARPKLLLHDSVPDKDAIVPVLRSNSSPSHDSGANVSSGPRGKHHHQQQQQQQQQQQPAAPVWERAVRHFFDARTHTWAASSVEVRVGRKVAGKKGRGKAVYLPEGKKPEWFLTSYVAKVCTARDDVRQRLY
eukprot:Opistho-2@75464